MGCSCPIKSSNNIEIKLQVVSKRASYRLKQSLYTPPYIQEEDETDINQLQQHFNELDNIKAIEFSQKKLMFLRSFWSKKEHYYNKKSTIGQTYYSYNSDRGVNVTRPRIKGILKNRSASNSRSKSKGRSQYSFVNETRTQKWKNVKFAKKISTSHKAI